MSRNGSRWYTFGRKIALEGSEVRAIEPGTVYEFIGWSRTEDSALAKRDKLDRAGRAGINIFAPSRQQAMADLVACYAGVTVEGYLSPAERKEGQRIVRNAVVRAIFCPYTNAILDMRRAIVVRTQNGQHVCSAAHWDKLSESAQDIIRAQEGTKVYDGREYFKGYRG
jgi:hypothetical protein